VGVGRRALAFHRCRGKESTPTRLPSDQSRGEPTSPFQGEVLPRPSPDSDFLYLAVLRLGERVKV